MRIPCACFVARTSPCEMHFGREELVRRVFAMGLNLNAQLIECCIKQKLSVKVASGSEGSGVPCSRA